MTKIVEPPRFLALVGGGEHARVVEDAAIAAGWTVAGIVNDQPVAHFAHHLGSEADIQKILETMPDIQFILAFGGVNKRRLAAQRMGKIPWATVVHPSAVISTSAQLAEGVFISAQAVVNPGAVVGAHVIINTAAVVEHDVVIGAYTHCCPGSVVGGGARIGEEVLLGLKAGVRDHVTIGDGVTVGMGAAVINNIAARATVVGVPAKAAIHKSPSTFSTESSP